MNEMIRGIGKSKTSAMDLKKIVDTVTVVYNDKVNEEKKATGGAKKNKKAKPMIAAGKGTGETYSRNNNPSMVNDLCGEEEEEYGEYGSEAFTGKEPEAAYDFM